MLNTYHRDSVFVAGGQPTITYVDRENQHIEREFARAIATPNQIVSLSGSTKTGKTVLCKKALGSRSYVWVDGGRIKTGEEFWEYVSAELNIPTETSSTKSSEIGIEGQGSIPFITTASGSKLWASEKTETRKINSMAEALNLMQSEKIVLVIDDFHYLPEEVRTDIMRNIKGAVFNGLKVILLSVTHRVFDALKAESELTGRFTAIILPNWSHADLLKIPTLGFKALNTYCPQNIMEKLCDEAQENPFLIQQFCWEICFDCGVETQNLLIQQKIPEDYDLNEMFIRIAKNAGLPIYRKLVAGPQSRKVRERRPLKSGGDADIYEVLLKAVALTGPKATVSYDEIKTSLGNLLKDKIPRKHEVTSAFKHLSKISKDIGADSAIDWDDDSREVAITDPYLRFYLRWQVGNSA